MPANKLDSVSFDKVSLAARTPKYKIVAVHPLLPDHPVSKRLFPPTLTIQESVSRRVYPGGVVVTAESAQSTPGKDT